MKSVFVLLLMTLLVPLSACADSGKDFPQIRISATGKVSVSPDLATLNLRLRHVAPTTDVARRQVDADSEAVLNLARAAGIGDADIRAAAIRAHPEYRWHKGEQHFRGQRVERTIELKVRDLGAYPELLVGITGINGVHIDAVHFGLQDPMAARTEAIKRAIASATERARVLAEGFGRQLGPVWHVQSAVQNDRPQPMMMRAEAMADAKSGPVMPTGEQEISESLSVVFALE